MRDPFSEYNKGHSKDWYIEQEIAKLAERINAEGLVQPVVLHRVQEGQYRIIAGHMRVEACKRLGWRSVPAVIRESE